ncbi:HET-domain-containing protein [Podospora aff. communis PSN243]|uniref:HET-domain-containing protein n=1 Tax=Podospora aff. communis PSN243 TaxID=3040156 RepID=A0AAV9G7Z1_9PEZI|nr:HET-domain-containing protein [Podospora aff. communis PSN243]
MTVEAIDFTYPSSANPDELRLLDPIAITQISLHFALIKVPRAAAPAYAAVSYTWGDDEPSEFIYLDNQRFSVRPNLWSCLHYLGRDALRSRTKLWVDAICINQNDMVERNSQVRRMDETYSRAAHVSVWLGLPKIPTPHHLQTTDFPLWFWDDNLPDLANRPYWSRVWVIQEFLLGGSIRLHCGDAQIEAHDFQEMLCHAAGVPQYNTSFSIPAHPAAAAFRALPLVTERHVDKHPELLQSLHDLLVAHRAAECKDPRDKIFGLLGLVTREERVLLQRFFPDYEMEVDHVRVIALAHVLQCNGLGGEAEVDERSDGVFEGLGIGEVTVKERRRYLARAGVRGFDYGDDWGVGEASRALKLLDDEGWWGVGGEDGEWDQTGRVRRGWGRFWLVVGFVLVVAAVVSAGWWYGFLELPVFM